MAYAGNNQSLPSSFFKTDKPHGLAKRTILKKYLQSWVPRMYYTNNPEICYLDGFAGAGVYGSKTISELLQSGYPNIEQFGSPIIALLVVLDHFDEVKASHQSIGRPRSAKFIFIEKDKDNVKKLTHNVKQCLQHKKYMLHEQVDDTEFIYRPEDETYPGDGRVSVKILNDEFKRVILVRLIPLCPVFAFVDPFGYSHTPMDVIRKLMSFSNVELFLNFMVQAVNRWQKDKQKHKAINDLFSCDEWPNVYDNPKEIEHVKACTALVHEYAYHLRYFTGCFTLCFCMKSENNSDLYSLVFANNDDYGFKNMKECMNRVTQDENLFVFSDFKVNEMGEMAPFRNDQDSKGPVADFIFNKFCGKRVELKDIEKAVILSKHVYIFRKESLKHLEEIGKIEKVEFKNPGKNWVRKKGTFPDDKCPIITFRSATQEEGLIFQMQNIGIEDTGSCCQTHLQ
ncbi:uncharacterized protein LOC117100906 [Anneissia japonica]|uniref:uncharacterized protein LOC117100906 n=1 Tax=Anneissia japonica TaxID=1529436 RepID=UPI0014258F6A|nr:uncharacterized protein LOC117100906 [Anneissia japonica]